MATSSVTFTLGSASFAAEADNQDWLGQQLDKFIETVKTLPRPPATDKLGLSASGQTEHENTLPAGTLATHIKAKKGETDQNKRFLATADWLRLKGSQKLTTAMVSKALSDNQQKRLANPAVSLNRNVAKGFCEKSADGFFITPEGLKDLGYG